MSLMLLKLDFLSLSRGEFQIHYGKKRNLWIDTEGISGPTLQFLTGISWFSSSKCESPFPPRLWQAAGWIVRPGQGFEALSSGCVGQDRALHWGSPGGSAGSLRSQQEHVHSHSGAASREFCRAWISLCPHLCPPSYQCSPSSTSREFSLTVAGELISNFKFHNLSCNSFVFLQHFEVKEELPRQKFSPADYSGFPGRRTFPGAGNLWMI